MPAGFPRVELTDNPQAALELAVRDQLREALGYQESQCDRQFNGQPPPASGPVYVSVWSPCDARNDVSGQVQVEALLSVHVTVTLRARPPVDRRVAYRDDLVRRTWAIAQEVHRDRTWNTVLARARAYLGGVGANHQFVEGLVYLDTSAVQDADASWFWCQPDTPAVGLYQTVRFGLARWMSTPEGLG